MATEIERKFLVKPWVRDDLASMAVQADVIVQGYLFKHDDRSLRVRTKGGKSYLTTKIGKGLSRVEVETEIPNHEAEQLYQFCPNLIHKVRYTIPHEDWFWEVDIFQGVNVGLVTAEIEMTSEDDDPAIPDWVGDEVTNDPRYSNVNLAEVPFTLW